MKKQTNAQLKKKLWKVFSEYIRKRDRGICFTCGRHAEGSGYHAGHFISKSVGGLALYFHEKNVCGQCYNCNINLGGNQYIFGTKLGRATVEELERERQKVIKDFPFEAKIAYYKEKIARL